MGNSTIFEGYVPPANSPYPASLEHLWHQIVTSYSPGTIDFFSGVLVELITFWFLGFLYTFVIPEPPLVPLQPVSRRPNAAGVRKAALGSLRNQLLIWVFHGLQCFSGRITGRPFRSHFKFSEPLPLPTEIAKHIALGILGRELLFYYGHRLMHHPKLYKHLHKKHHEYVAPVAYSAQYCTFTEHVVSNILPLLIPAVLMRYVRYRIKR